MLACVACSRSAAAAAARAIGGGGRGRWWRGRRDDASTRQAIKAHTTQIKDMALKASGAYRHCKPCAGSSAGGSGRHHLYHHRGSSSGFRESETASGSGRFHYAYRLVWRVLDSVDGQFFSRICVPFLCCFSLF